ncbi:MAG: hypothetical protein M3472_02455 [Chloroflexota bacterium]|jgi:hypothetical protein|nr:hypothetical protein [Chloroflexota bacterium]
MVSSVSKEVSLSRPQAIRRAAMILLVVASVMAIGATLTTATPAQAASCGSTFEESLDFREAFGLSTDPELIQRLLDDPAADCTWGVPLTPEESDEMDRRNSVELYIRALAGYVDRHDDDFGGLYIDQGAGGTVVLLTIPSTTQAQVDEALSLVDRGAPGSLEVVTREVKYSQRRLYTTQDEIEDLWADPRMEGIVGFGPSIIENRVEVDILVPRFAAVRDFLLGRYPEDLLSFVERTSGDSAACGWCDEDPPETHASVTTGVPSSLLAALAAAFGATTAFVLARGPRRRRISSGK